jgi:hypothetical protein
VHMLTWRLAGNENGDPDKIHDEAKSKKSDDERWKLRREGRHQEKAQSLKPRRTVPPLFKHLDPNAKAVLFVFHIVLVLGLVNQAARNRKLRR